MRLLPLYYVVRPKHWAQYVLGGGGVTLSPEDYLVQTHLHVLENIKLADQKATAFVAIDSAVMAALYGGKLFLVDPSTPVLTSLSLATFVLLALGVSLGCLVLWPRGETIAHQAPGGDLAIPSKIPDEHSTPEKYRAAVIKAASDDPLEPLESLTGQLASLTLVRCKINDIKYGYLRRAIVASGLGFALTAVFVVVHSVLRVPGRE